jgi:hypothetical protein
MSEQAKTATELAWKLKRKHPDHRFATAGDGNGIGVWDEKRGCFIAIIEKTIMANCPWVYTGGNLPMVNGKPVERDWQEVQLAPEGVRV